MKLLGKILASIFGVLIPIALIVVICYLTIPGFKTKVDDAFNKPETEENQETETEGTEEGTEQVPETTAFVSFSNNTIKIEV